MFHLTGAKKIGSAKELNVLLNMWNWNLLKHKNICNCREHSEIGLVKS